MTTIQLTTPGILYAEHEALVAAEAAAWAEAERHPTGAPGHDAAVAHWSKAKAALDGFPARLAGIPATDPKLVRFKARVLAGLNLGDLDFAIGAALRQAATGDHAADGALALSIARDVLAA